METALALCSLNGRCESGARLVEHRTLSCLAAHRCRIVTVALSSTSDSYGRTPQTISSHPVCSVAPATTTQKGPVPIGPEYPHGGIRVNAQNYAPR